MLAPVLALVLASPILPAQGPSPPGLRLPTPNPRVFTSDSGSCELHVDWQDEDGRGAARYELRRDGDLLWAEEHELTLKQVVVGDDGAAAGVAITGGPGAEMVLALLRPDGELERLYAEPRVLSRFVDGPWTPWTDGVFVHDGVLVFQVADPDLNRQSETWKRFLFPSGDPLPDVDPKASQADAEKLLGVFDAVPIAGTPFVLVHWQQRSPGSGSGARFALLDVGGAAAWSLDLPIDYVYDTVMQVRREGAIRVGAPAAFALRHASDDVRVEYAVQRGGDGAWTVRETARAPWREAPASAFPLLEAKLARTLRLDVGGGTVADAALGPDDRIHALVAETGVVCVFDARGKPLHRCTPDAGDRADGPDGFAPRGLSVEPDGHVLVDLGGDGWVIFDASGDREAVERLPVRGALPVALPDGGRLLPKADGAYLSANGETKHIRRGSDGTWLGRILDAGAAEDGSFVLATGGDWLATERRIKLHGFAPDGAPTWTFHAAGDADTRIAYDGRFTAIASGGRVLLIEGPRAVGVLEVPVDDATPLLPRGARELGLAGADGRVRCYALK